MARDGIMVAYGGIEISDVVTREQVSTVIWAALRKERYVEGSECRVMVALTPDSVYEIEAQAKEPNTHWLRLVDLAIPSEGLSDEDFGAFLAEQGLSDFAAAPDDRMMIGVNATAQSVKTQAEAGRNDPCPCGSGKKFKKCHLQ